MATQAGNTKQALSSEVLGAASVRDALRHGEPAAVLPEAHPAS